MWKKEFLKAFCDLVLKITSSRSPDFSVYGSEILFLKPLGFPNVIIHIYYQEMIAF